MTQNNKLIVRLTDIDVMVFCKPWPDEEPRLNRIRIQRDGSIHVFSSKLNYFTPDHRLSEDAIKIAKFYAESVDNSLFAMAASIAKNERPL